MIALRPRLLSRLLVLAAAVAVGDARAVASECSFVECLSLSGFEIVALVVGIVLMAVLATFAWRSNRALSAKVKELAEAQHELRDSETQFRALAEASAAGVYVMRGSHILAANSALAQMTGYSMEELTVLPFGALLHGEDRNAVLAQALPPDNAGTVPKRSSFRMTTKVGDVRWVEHSATRAVYKGRKVVIGTLYDVSEHRRLTHDLQTSRTLYKSIMLASPDGVAVTDLDGVIRQASPSAMHLLRADDDVHLAGLNIRDLGAPEALAHLEAEFRGLLKDGKGFREREFRVRRFDGSEVDTEVSVEFLRDPDDHPRGLLFVIRDVTERKKAEASIRQMAHQDPLTGLANRSLFEDRLSSAIANARRDGTQLALMFLDLDRFKPVNDTHGHAVGDKLLKEVAGRIVAQVRASDTVARVGGDEFVVLLRNVNAVDDALHVAEKIRLTLNEPFALEGLNLEISSCTGVAIYPTHGADAVSLTRAADLAMYAAKESGRNAVRLYQPRAPAVTPA